MSPAERERLFVNAELCRAQVVAHLGIAATGEDVAAHRRFAAECEGRRRAYLAAARAPSLNTLAGEA